MITQKEADEILSHVAQNLISPLAFDDRPAGEVWLELSASPFNKLCAMVYEMVEQKEGLKGD